MTAVPPYDVYVFSELRRVGGRTVFAERNLSFDAYNVLHFLKYIAFNNTLFYPVLDRALLSDPGIPGVRSMGPSL